MIPTNKNNFCFFKNSDIIEAAPIVLVYVISTHTTRWPCRSFLQWWYFTIIDLERYLKGFFLTQCKVGS